MKKFPVAHPAVVGSIITPAGLAQLQAKSVPCDLIEVRVDALLAAKATPEEILAALKKRRQPVLLTLRIPPEGGHITWRGSARRDLFLHLLPHVEAIDIELATAKAMAPVIAEVRCLGLTVVLSAHSIAKPATPTQMTRWTKAFSPAPRTVLKIASRIESWRDLQRLAALLVNHPEWAVAVMGVGPHAAQSRSVLASLGSRLAYGYLDQPAAPGQPSAVEVREMVKATLAR